MHYRSVVINRTTFFICFIFLFAFASDRAHGSDAETHPLSFREDAVIITGKEISALLGAKISSLNLASVINGELRPIPFQVDEVRQGICYYSQASKIAEPRGERIGIVFNGQSGF